MFKIELPEAVLKNIYFFLNRVELKGHEERKAMNEIELALSSAVPVQQETDK